MTKVGVWGPSDSTYRPLVASQGTFQKSNAEPSKMLEDHMILLEVFKSREDVDS